MPHSSLDLLDPTRRAILVALKRLHSATAEEVAAHCFLSVGAARQHLQTLEAQGFIDHEPERRGPGRPRHRYLLTPRAEALFPKLHHEALISLLEAVAAEPVETRERILERLEARVIDTYRATLERESRGSPLRGAVAVFEDAGYMPEVEERPGETRLVLHHCPVAEAAAAHPLLCEVEQRCLAAAVRRTPLRRTAWQPAGDPVCAYVFEPGDG
jgi:DeoR family suf operon transcriptional repressor